MAIPARMSARGENWAIVLAAGDGTRLSSLTTDERGEAVPKQYCSLNGGGSLLQEALQRAQRIVPRERVCAIVAQQHERHWRHMLRSLPARNVIVQPRSCGTANGVLLGLLAILERDPLAHIVFLPADHYVHNEASLANSMRASAMFSHDRDGLTLLGIEPDDIDIELGYIVPGDPLEGAIRRVEQFVEKPNTTFARELIARGALWNSFIFWARGTTLLELIHGRLSEIVEEMMDALVRDRRGDRRMSAVKELYERLSIVDFSRAVMQGAESALRVSTAPPCGWTDLGTPRRVARTLQRLRLASSSMRPPESVFPVIASVDLAAQYARLSCVNSAPANDF
jgi:mannose-1-phosphate guanylyltransferase